MIRALCIFIITSCVFLVRADAAYAETYPVFMEQEVSKKSIYVGEQTLYNFTLNTQTSVFNYQPPELSLPHAWSEVIAVNQRYRRTIDGELWTAYSTRRAIYPLSPGDLNIPDLSIPIGIRVKTRRKVPAPFDFGDAFSDDFLEQFFAEVEPKTIQLKTKGETVTVRPLPPPPANLPPAPNGYIPVGATSLSGRATRQQLSVGESVSIEFNLVSVGNLNPVTELNLQLPPGLRVYPEQAKNSQTENNFALIMRRTFRYGLVPISPGTYRIDSVKVPYFDPDTGTYQTAESSPFVFEVRGEARASTATIPQPAMTVGDVLTPVPTPIPAPTSSQMAAEDPSFIGDIVSTETVALIAVTTLSLIGLVSLTIILYRRRRPLKNLRRELSHCQSMAQLCDSFRSILIRNLTSAQGPFTYEEMTVLIKRAHLPTDLEYATLNLLDHFEQRRFSPGFEETHDLPRLKRETLHVASGILTHKA